MNSDLLLRAELARDEGRRLVAYQDSVGLWTIGVGHLLGTEKRILRITDREADAFLAWDIVDAEQIVASLLPDIHLNSGTPELEVRYRALVNMAFNLGSRLAQFKKFLAAVEAENWTEAGEHMMNSLWAKQVGARAIRLRKMIVEGVV